MRRKIFAAIIAFAVVVISITARTREPRPALPTHRPNLNPMLCAHRGVKMMAPENTLPAIAKAIEMGYNYAEIDVRYTRDGVPVLMHDDWITRMTLMPGPPRAYSLATLKKFRAGFWRGPEFADTRIPTMEEVLKLMQGRIKLYLDQKEMPRPQELKLLKDYGFFPDNMVIVGGGPQQKKFVEWDPAAPVMPGVSRVEDLSARLKEFPDMVAIDAPCETLSAELIDAAHAAGLMVFTDVVNQLPFREEACMRRPIELGSDVIQIDNPALFQKLIEEYRKR